MPTQPSRPSPEDDAELVVFSRHALLEFFGKMALPPWTDERGRTIGGRIDCAVIASEISEWVDEHDLTPVMEVTPR